MFVHRGAAESTCNLEIPICTADVCLDCSVSCLNTTCPALKTSSPCYQEAARLTAAACDLNCAPPQGCNGVTCGNGSVAALDEKFDTNGDCSITSADASAVRDHIVINDTAERDLKFDVNGDGQVTAGDAGIIDSYITEFHCGTICIVTNCQEDLVPDNMIASDVNYDCQVNADDVRAIETHISAIPPPQSDLRYDTNRDGQVDDADVLHVTNYLTSFTCPGACDVVTNCTGVPVPQEMIQYNRNNDCVLNDLDKEGANPAEIAVIDEYLVQVMCMAPPV